MTCSCVESSVVVKIHVPLSVIFVAISIFARVFPRIKATVGVCGILFS